MKELTATLLLLIIACSFSFATQAANSSKKKQMQEVTFVVSMECHSCKAKIEKNIPWEKGVKDLIVDLEKKTVRIIYNPKQTNEEKLRKAIESLNFTCRLSE